MVQGSKVLDVQEVSKSYKKTGVPVHALNGISFTVFENEFISVIGKSGSGKSTLLNLLGGLDQPTSGSIIFKNRNLRNYSRFELTLHRRNTVGMIFQSFNLIPSKTALENVAMALLFNNWENKSREKIAENCLSKVEMTHRLHHKPSELSGGEAQRVAIARALANNPPVILADEATGNLDSETAASIIKLLTHLNKDEAKTIIMVTHDKENAEIVSDRLIELKDGQIISK